MCKDCLSTKVRSPTKVGSNEELSIPIIFDDGSNITRRLCTIVTRSRFKAEVISIAQVFADEVDQPFLVPELQRTFVWSDKVTKELWEDMQYHLDSKVLKEMFLGTIITFKNVDKDKTVDLPRLNELKKLVMDKIKPIAENIGIEVKNKKRAWLINKIHKKRGRTELIDGQQRLTVLLIGIKLLAEISEKKKLDKDLVKRLNNHLKYKNGEIRLHHRLSLERDDFANILNNHTGDDELLAGWSSDISEIRIAYKESLKFLTKLTKPTIKKFAKLLLDDVKVVYLGCTDITQQHLVFNAVNYAGLKLTDGQLFKSELYHRAALMETKSNYKDVREIWERNIAEKIDKLPKPQDPITEFLYRWGQSIEVSSKFKKNDTFKRLSKGKLKTLGTGDVLPLVNTMRAASKIYLWLQKPDNSLDPIYWSDIYDFAKIYDRGGLSPVLMAIYENLNEIERGICIDMLRLCTAFLVIPKNRSKTAFADKTINVWINLIREKKILDLKKKVREYFENNGYESAKGKSQGSWNKTVQKTWQTAMKTQRLGEAEAKFLLRNIEGLKEIRGGPHYISQYNTWNLHAEHIFPKTTAWTSARSSQWHKDWNDDNTLWPEDFESRDELKHFLGNFIILEREVNTPARNRTWLGPNLWNPKNPEWKTDRSGTIIETEDRGHKLRKLKADCGKAHYFCHNQWVGKDGNQYDGSQLETVKDFVKNMSGKSHWRKSLLEKRTKKLLTMAVNYRKVPSFSLSKLWR